MSDTQQFMDRMQNILDQWSKGADKEDLHGTLVGAREGLGQNLSPVKEQACDLAYQAVEKVLDKPRNVFCNIDMGSDTLLALFSEMESGFFHTIFSGDRSIQFILLGHSPGLPENVVHIADRSGDEVIVETAREHLVHSDSRFMRRGYKLERVSKTKFQNIWLQERELMLILSCTEPITVKDVKGKEGSVFIAGRVSRHTIATIAELLEIDLDPNDGDGVFQTRLTGA